MIIYLHYSLYCFLCYQVGFEGSGKWCNVGVLYDCMALYDVMSMVSQTSACLYGYCIWLLA